MNTCSQIESLIKRLEVRRGFWESEPTSDARVVIQSGCCSGPYFETSSWSWDRGDANYKSFAALGKIIKEINATIKEATDLSERQKKKIQKMLPRELGEALHDLTVKDIQGVVDACRGICRTLNAQSPFSVSSVTPEPRNPFDNQLLLSIDLAAPISPKDFPSFAPVDSPRADSYLEGAIPHVPAGSSY